MSVLVKNELGTIVINKDVIASIAANAVMECYGVVGLTYKSAQTGIARLLKGEHMSKGVDLYEEDGKIFLSLYVIIQFGTKISVVAENIIEKVKYNVENQTGITVADIDLNIEGVKVRK